MKLRLLQATKTQDMIIAALGAALLLTVQVALAGLANIELVSLLVMLYTLYFGRRVLYCIYVFALLEGLIYGFAMWWVTYLYVWTILAGITWLFRKAEPALFWAAVSGIFGLAFGALCSVPYFIAGGAAAGAAYWISGIPFDIVHCAGNFVLCLVLWKPMRRVFDKIPLA